MKTKERLKNILIIVLLCGAVYLTYATWYFDSPLTNVPFWQIIINPTANHLNPALGGRPINGEDSNTIRPLSATINTDTGRFGAPYGTNIINAIYDRTSLLMAEALGSAAMPAAVGEAEWESALQKKGVFYDYRGTVFIDSLSIWLNAGRSASISETARYILLCIDEDEDEVFLYIKNPDTDRILRYNTALSVNDASSPLSGIYGNNCVLALELDGGFELILPETPITPELPSPPAITGYNPVMHFTEDKLQALFKIFGINSYNVNPYTEQDGTSVFIEDILTLRISQNGIISFTDSRSSDETQLGVTVKSAYNLPTEIEYFETALELAQSMHAQKPGAESVYLMDFRYLEDTNEYVAMFGISLDGIPIDMPDTTYFARVIFRGKKVRSAVFNMRYYETSVEAAKVLPERLAVAAMLGNNQSGDLNLRYSDKGAYPLFPSWHIKTNSINQDG